MKKITKHFDLLKKAISFDKTETSPNKTIQISADDGIYIYEECIVQQREVQHKMEEPLTRSFCCVYTTMKSV